MLVVMSLTSPTPIRRTAVSDEVFARLVQEILTGAILPGEPLPSERELAETFAVNRHAIREALKRVRQAGLVLIAQGGKTRVLDWQEHAGLDVLVELVRVGVVPPLRMLRDIAEMRMSVGADAVRACAERGSEEVLARLVAAAADYPALEADAAFWGAIIEGADNLAYRLSYNTLLAAILDLGVESFHGLLEEYADRDAHVHLASLIAERRATEAHEAATRLLRRAVTQIDQLDRSTQES